MVETHIKASKFLSWALRHAPGKIGLTLDPAGWASIEELLDCAARAGRRLDAGTIYEIVETDSKGRYELSPDLARIRAVYGHSVPVDLGLVPAEPPALLYHGTGSWNVHSILRGGIIPGRRRYVHLSTTPGTARQVGARHGDPAVLAVEAGRMAADGLALYRMNDEIWMTDEVPARYIRPGEIDWG